MNKIKNIIYQVEKVPLIEPYKLSYKTLDYYESIIVSIILDDEKVLYGEVTPLIGYTDETVEDVLKELQRVQNFISGMDIQMGLKLLYKEVNISNSFALSAIIPPMEEYLSHYKKFENIVIHKKDLIYALKSEQSLGALKEEFERLIQDGYTTVKIKVGKSLIKEIILIQSLASIDLGNLKIRFDANGGYSFEEAKIFLDKLESIKDNVEYLEQPVERNAWDDLRKLLALKFTIPIMIDESIYSLEDIKKAYDIGAKFIKIKLCKYGSWYHLQEALDYANSLGLKVVFGNGVATDIANYYEMIFYLNNKNKIHGATEGVGFLKLKKFQKFNLEKG